MSVLNYAGKGEAVRKITIAKLRWLIRNDLEFINEIRNNEINTSPYIKRMYRKVHKEEAPAYNPDIKKYAITFEEAGQQSLDEVVASFKVKLDIDMISADTKDRKSEITKMIRNSGYDSVIIEEDGRTVIYSLTKSRGDVFEYNILKQSIDEIHKQLKNNITDLSTASLADKILKKEDDKLFFNEAEINFDSFFK